MSWNTTPDAPAVAGTTLYINGSSQNLADNVGEVFSDVIVAAARNANMGKFRVILNGDEINPADAPENVEAGMTIELKPYDVAGSAAWSVLA